MQSESSAPMWGVREISLGVVSYAIIFGMLLGSARLMVWLGLDVPTNLKPVLNGAIALLLEGLLLLPVWFFAIARARGTWHAVGFRRVDVLRGCVLPLLYLWVAFGISFLWGLVVLWMQWPRQPLIVPVFRDNPIAIVLGFVAVCIVAPIAEETFFRGFVLGGLRARFGVLWALLISSVCFMLPHLPITIYPAIFGLGLLLGTLFAQTNSLWPSIILHAAFNTIGFAAQFAVSR